MNANALRTTRCHAGDKGGNRMSGRIQDLAREFINAIESKDLERATRLEGQLERQMTEARDQLIDGILREERER